MKVARKSIAQNESAAAGYNELTGRCSFKTSKARREYMAWSKVIVKCAEDYIEFKKKTEQDLGEDPVKVVEQLDEYLKEEIELPEFVLKDEDFEGSLSGVALKGLEFLGVIKYEQS